MKIHEIKLAYFENIIHILLQSYKMSLSHLPSTQPTENCMYMIFFKAENRFLACNIYVHSEYFPIFEGVLTL